MKRYVIAGPWRDYQEWVPGCYGGPRDTGRDVFLVDAPTAKTAKWAAYKTAKQQHMAWWTDLGTDEHPLAGCDARQEPREQPEHWGDHYIKVTNQND